MTDPIASTGAEIRIIGAGPAYADGSEDSVLAILNAASDRSTASDELAGHISDWPTRYHFSRLRSNLLRPLRIRAGMRVLDVGSGTGVMARYAAEQGASVVALEGTLARAKATRARCSGMDGVEVVCGALDAFTDDDGFDCVLCIGVLEYAGPDHAAFLRRLRDLTRPDGALVLAIENQLGLKYLLGYGEDHLGEPWVGVEAYPAGGTVRTFSRRQLSALLSDAGFDRQRWHFPFPDYKTPGVILSEAAYQQPDQEVFVDALVRWPCDRHASEPVRVCDDRRAHRAFLAAGLGPDVANSFLVVAGADDGAASRLVGSQVTAWFYGSERSRAWLGSKVFSAGPGGEIRLDSVDSTPDPAADGWLRQIRPDHQQRVVGHTLEQLALAACESGAEALREVLQRWRSHLRGLESPTGPAPERDDHPFRDDATRSLLPADHLDVDLANFVVDARGDIHYIDSEWVLPSGIDADMACARALWGFATEVVSRGALHPWPRSTTIAALVEAMGLLCSTPAGPAELDRWRRAEALLQAEITGRKSEELLPELLAMGDRSQTGPEVVRALPFTDLRRRLIEHHAELERARTQLEAYKSQLQAERADRRVTQADTDAARRRAEAELDALQQTRTLRYTERARALYTRLRRLAGRP